MSSVIEYPDGTSLAAIPYSEEPKMDRDTWTATWLKYRPSETLDNANAAYDQYAASPLICGDCKCKVGEYHIPGCDEERCPKCNGQLISCGCLGTDEDED